MQSRKPAELPCKKRIQPRIADAPDADRDWLASAAIARRDLGSRALLSSKLLGARFPLYRSQILQENTRWKASCYFRVFEIAYSSLRKKKKLSPRATQCIPLHRRQFSKFRENFNFAFFKTDAREKKERNSSQTFCRMSELKIK